MEKKRQVIGMTEEYYKKFGEHAKRLNGIFPFEDIRPYPNQELVGFPLPHETPFAFEQYTPVNEYWCVFNQL